MLEPYPPVDPTFSVAGVVLPCDRLSRRRQDVTTLHDRLAALAEAAPTELTDDALWERGLRYRRRRAAPTYVGAALAVLLVGALALTGQSLFDDTAPAPSKHGGVPFTDLHLPRTILEPSPWTKGTDQLGPPGPLAVVSLADRKEVRGWDGIGVGWYSYGISAVDGSMSFLDLPGNNVGESDAQPVLSPDGRKVGYVRRVGAKAVGWAVYDTVTGETVKLTDPEAPHPVNSNDLAFSGDSRYLLTSYSPERVRGRDRTHRFVAWDVQTGRPTLLEPPGMYWLPTLGLASHTIVWSRGQVTHSFDPATGRTEQVSVPQDVVMASYGPNDRAFAYVGHRPVPEDRPARWRLFVGTDARSAPEHEVTGLPFEPGVIVGWRDAHTVAVVRYRGPVALVDVRTGKVTEAGADISGNWTSIASDLWANALVEATPPPDVLDPVMVRRTGLVASGLLIGGLLAVLRWRRRVAA